MTRRGKASTLCGMALVFILAAGYCFYKAIDAGVTAEEGLKYGLPAMKADPRYSKQQIDHAESEFRKLDRAGDEWSSGAAALFLFATASGITGLLMFRHAKSS